ncbi:MAG: AAA-like domain-containing protein [Desulfobacterales bacterium]|nr:AAA-like domain-containing protein [Desulfobacterales bacterium]
MEANIGDIEILRVKRGKVNMNYRRPKRYFEKSGVVYPDASYYVSLENVTNMDNQDIKTMVDLGRYFSIFAPRQSGKTTFFEGFCHDLEENPAYVAILLSFQTCKSLDKQRFYQLIQKDLYSQLINRLDAVNCPKLDAVKQCIDSHNLTDHISFSDLFEELNRVIEFKKIVIFIDEFDGVPIGELENFLATLRDLYQRYKKRTDKALYSIGLVGIRNVTKLVVGGVSPFNIADQVKLPPFSLKNVRDLYAQYTEDTNQPFTEEAVKKVFDDTAGQPWLVNRLGTILTINVKPETTEPISKEDVEKAIDILLYEENSHFDNITEKAKQYKETFIDVVFNGVEYIPGDEEQSLLLTHGLIKAEGKHVYVSNAIYKKRFTRTFFRESGAIADVPVKGYIKPDGLLDMEAVLGDFEEYIIQIGVNAFYASQKPYEKTGQFLLTAWLYQFVEGGKGELRFETRTGLGRMDILLNYQDHKYIIETKINRSHGTRTLDKAIEQVSGKYLSTERVHEGYIVIFDLKTMVGELCAPHKHIVKGKEILSFNIGIGR